VANEAQVVRNIKLDAQKYKQHKKRELKVMDKVLSMKAKESKRLGRGDDMNYFVVYYKEKCAGLKLTSLML